MLPGDSIVLENQTLQVVETFGFNLKDSEEEARFLLINTKAGSMEGYVYTLDQIFQEYKIKQILQNENSHIRKAKA